MSWTYGNNPGASLVDRIRFLSGDTNEDSEATCSDEEITFLHSTFGVTEAAAQVAERRGREFGSMNSLSIDGLSLDYGSQAQAQFDAAERIRANGRRTGSVPVMRIGGTGPTFTGTNDEDMGDIWARRHGG